MTRTILGIFTLCFMLWPAITQAQSSGPIACVVIKTSDGDITLDQYGLHLRDYLMLPVRMADSNKVLFQDRRTSTRAVLDISGDNELCLTIYEDALAMKVTTCWKNVAPNGEKVAFPQQADGAEKPCKRMRDMLRGTFASFIPTPL